jgi:hypothetical protein
MPSGRVSGWSLPCTARRSPTSCPMADGLAGCRAILCAAELAERAADPALRDDLDLPRRTDPGRALSEPAGLLDTSVFIAREVERPLGELPDRVTVSVVTIGELELGVLSAVDAALGLAGGHPGARPDGGARPDQRVDHGRVGTARGRTAGPPASSGPSSSPTR